MCYSVISEDLCMILYCPDKYKTQRMYDEAVYDCLSIADWVVTSKMLEKLIMLYTLMIIY